MPILRDEDFQQQIVGSNYKFSGVRIDSLSGETEYTLGVILVDVSGSTSSFRKEMEQALQNAVEGCRKNPRADRMLLRVAKFDDVVTEIHGFKPLRDCNAQSYVGCLGAGGGTTALYDACYTATQSAMQYAKELTDKEYDVNVAVYVITDGCEYPKGNSKATPKMVREALISGVQEEKVESAVSILVGINLDKQSNLDAILAQVKTDCGFSQFVGIADASPGTLAKMGDFISQSISSQSQALGTGGPSQALTF